MFHPKALTLWLVAALLPFTLTKNPFYLFIALLVASVNYFVLRRRASNAHAWGSLLRFSIVLALFSITFNILFVSIGATRLVTLPALRLDFGTFVLQIGGAVTLESLTYGLAQALGLIGLILTFAAFNLIADHYEILRAAPRFLHQSALVLTIGVNFVPQVMLAQEEIREALALRGHRFRSVRDLPPLFIALVAEGLERSVTLAESMSARGFGHTQAGRNPGTMSNALIALGLFLAICGVLVMNYFSNPGMGLPIVALGIGTLAWALARIGRNERFSRYNAKRWQRHDWMVAGAALMVIGVWLGAWMMDRSLLDFYPYPRLNLPSFNFFVALSILGLVMPALVVIANRQATKQSPLPQPPP